jgi:proteasome lid subunit RPN8/RPN11
MADQPKKDDVKLVGSSSEPKPRWRKFPGPPGAREKLRVAMSRQAYADLIAHAKESLSAEVCGVLVGEWCEDDNGQFISVEGTIRGKSAKQASTHVTFTQDTWNEIHKEKDKKHPKKQIVGWYHTHPGFGVEFSDMDLFIQRNFFGGAGQIAFVTDPLGGDESILVNENGGVAGLSKFWVDGRERRCNAPPEAAAPSASAPAHVSGELEKSVRALEERVSQLMLAVEAQHNALSRFLMGVGVFVGMALIFWIGYNVYLGMTRDYKPPEVNGFVPVPVQIGDKTVMIGLGILKWEVPKELNAAYLELERQKQAAEENERKQHAATQSTTAPAAAPSTSP